MKGLPIKVTVNEVDEHGQLQKRDILSSYEDSYTAQLREVYEWARNGKGIKTTAEDALEDLKIFDGMYQAWGAAARGSVDGANTHA